VKSARYHPSGVLAIMPSAIGASYDRDDESPVKTATIDGSVAIVPIRGPLMQHEQPWFDSYESIVDRVALALRTSPMAVVLSISSPGGCVAGLFEACDSIRSMCSRAGVQLHAYVDGMAASAGYALAAACDSVTSPATGIAGSIGVVASVVDASEQLAKEGVKVRLITSGARKGDGDSSQPMTDEAVLAMQSQVDAMASQFFEHVAARRSMSASDVAGLEAAVYTGSSAIDAGLVDRIGTLDELVGLIASGAMAEGESGMEEQMKIAVDAINAIMADPECSEDMMARCKKALEALTAEGEQEAPEEETVQSMEEEDVVEMRRKVAALEARVEALQLAASSMASDLESRPSDSELESQKAASARAELVDSAVRSGRIAASSRGHWLAVAERDMSAARDALALMPAMRHRVSSSSESKSAPRPAVEPRGSSSNASDEARRLLRLVLDKDSAERASASIK
jgi:signal peptide peptidase SppA